MINNYDYVYKCFRWIISETACYYNEATIPDELKSKWEKFYNCISDSVDWFNLTFDDVTRLGFLNWDDGLTNIADGVWFIPEWLLPAIPEGIIVYTKDGEQFEFHKHNYPKETMFGYLTFGIRITRSYLI